MPLWLQHLLVLLLVGACASYTLWGVTRTLWGKRSRIGSCCARGCSATQNPANAKAPGSRVIFLPAEFLGRKPR
jgi:hypothetical protein